MVAKIKDKITLDKLVLMVARGFDQGDKRFARLELNDQVIRNDLSEIQHSISYIKEEAKETNSRLSDLDYKMDKLTKSIKEDVDALFLGVAKVKQKVGVK